MRYKMIVLDVDGTLINDEKIITPKTKDALIAVQRQGVIVVLASGRPAPGLKRESDALELEKYHGLLLSYNGGKVIDVTTKKVIYQKSIPRETATRLLKHLETFPVTPIVDDGTYIYTTDEDGYQIRYESQNNNLKIKIVNNLADDINFCPIKILIAAPNEVLLSASKKIMAPFENELSFTLSAPFYLEATMKGVSKASSLRIICNILNIKPEEVMAFGDAQNDILMIEFAGLGVAMGNACEELKAIADEVTLSNNEDGIAHTLKKYYEI
ncbi:Cof-like hydrolase [Thermoanaerobacter italicus Ab9]|uniref:Cof-like hydrolase n=1 Tax=Thermoanaerobacter italicus (strain DSM 9252 / Ab9) TaxID=580331 RepID=D3T6K3_THEIA|nr:Cof-type HAD-IIB family hydrolase [Thermoanaerobacter italicus]ADD01616.1 Cof-like hydrolase [Thermoanaerobacter italicus Ab9]